MKHHQLLMQNGSEWDVLHCRDRYGHKAGGATIYAKRLSNRLDRRAGQIELRQEVGFTADPDLGATSAILATQTEAVA